MEQTSKKRTAKPYSAEFLARAVRLAMEHRDEYQSEAAALTAIAGKLGCSPDSLRVWVRQAQRDGGERPGQTTAEKARIKKLNARSVNCGKRTRSLRKRQRILRWRSSTARFANDCFH